MFLGTGFALAVRKAEHQEREEGGAISLFDATCSTCWVGPSLCFGTGGDVLSVSWSYSACRTTPAPRVVQQGDEGLPSLESCLGSVLLVAGQCWVSLARHGSGMGHGSRLAASAVAGAMAPDQPLARPASPCICPAS